MTFEETFYGRPNTIKANKSLFRNHIEVYKDLSIEEMLKNWTDRGLSAQTVKQLLSLAARYIEWRDGKKPNIRRITYKTERLEGAKLAKSFTFEQCELFLNTWELLYPKSLPIVKMALYTGMRPGEVFGLQWGDIDFLRGKIRILRSYDQPSKNGRGRVIAMPKLVEQMLQQNYLYKDDDSFIFKKVKINPKMKRVCAAAGLPPITFHGLRHTFATIALNKGRNIKAVSEALGHSSVKVTLDTYWNVFSTDLDMELFDER